MGIAVIDTYIFCICACYYCSHFTDADVEFTKRHLKKSHLQLYARTLVCAAGSHKGRTERG